jgi:hypothetical protein
MGLVQLWEKQKAATAMGMCFDRGPLFLFGKVSRQFAVVDVVSCDKLYSSFGLGFEDGSELATYV